MLFFKGDCDSIQVMMDAVDTFSSISGLIPNISKSLIFFGNVPSATKDFACVVSGFNRGVLPVTYLGLPLISGKLNTRDCQPLVTKICGRFEDWGSKHISQAGCTQLIKAVIYGILGNWSEYLFLPKSVLKKVQSLMAKFLWKGSISGACHYKVAWKYCCLKKSEGGLGFKELLG